MVAQSSKGKKAGTTRPLTGLGPQLSIASLAAYSTGQRSHKGTQIWGGDEWGHGFPLSEGEVITESEAIANLPQCHHSYLPVLEGELEQLMAEPQGGTDIADCGVWRARLSGYMAARRVLCKPEFGGGLSLNASWLCSGTGSRR